MSTLERQQLMRGTTSSAPAQHTAHRLGVGAGLGLGLQRACTANGAAASNTQGCSLRHIGLQPPAHRVAGASSAPITLRAATIMVKSLACALWKSRSLYTVYAYDPVAWLGLGLGLGLGLRLGLG